MRHAIHLSCVLICSLTPFNIAFGQTLVADYQFQNSTASTVQGAPALVPIGPSAYTMDAVAGETRTVLDFPAGSGLLLTPPSGIINTETYTIVLLFKYDELSGYKKVVDFSNRTIDEGAYLYEGQFNIYPEAESDSVFAFPGVYLQYILTRDSNNVIRGYADGDRAIAFSDLEDIGVVSQEDSLFFFLDDASTGFDEVGPGSVARIRMYDGALDPAEVASLDLLPVTRIQGNVSYDGRVTVQDVVILARMLVGLVPPPGDGTEGFERADANENGLLEVGDVVRTVQFILGIPPTKTLASGPPIGSVELASIRTNDMDQQSVPIHIRNSRNVSALQATLTYDPILLEIGKPYVADQHGNHSLVYHVADGTLRIIVFSTSEASLPSDAGDLIMLPVNIRSGTTRTASVLLEQVVLAGRSEEIGLADIGNRILRISSSATPLAFSLDPARPNPFNPSTEIAYTIPSNTPVTLTVYNSAGPEIARLVDSVQTAGQYNVRWNGTNASGLTVSSGVYLFQVSTGAGHRAVRRVTLVK